MVVRISVSLLAITSVSGFAPFVFKKPAAKASMPAASPQVSSTARFAELGVPFRPEEESWFKYYGLAGDFSKVGLVSGDEIDALVQKSEEYINMRVDPLPPIDDSYTLEMIEAENKEWFPTHCATYFSGRGDLNLLEYYKDMAYHMSDGLIFGADNAHARETQWPLGPDTGEMTWPLIQFQGELLYFEWIYYDKFTHEGIAKGSCTMARRGHKGGIYYKSEQLSFYRDVYAKKD